MAVFTNLATLSFSGGSVNSNIVTGEIVEMLSLDKDAVNTAYEADDSVTFVISLDNSGETDLNDLTLTEDLGGYAIAGGETVYPLAYREGSLLAYSDGVQKSAPAVNAGPPMVITGVNVPAGGSTLLVFQTQVTPYAPLAEGASITATVTAEGAGLAEPLTASVTLTAASSVELTIHKTVAPAEVVYGGTLTYTFLIRNEGSAAADAAALLSVTDTFDPVLSGITVTLDGTPMASGTGYAYNETSGEFSTVPGVITVPAATYTQEDTGVWDLSPGIATLVVTGTI